MLVGLIVTAIFVYLNSGRATLTAQPKQPTFSFDTTKAPGWWSPGNYSSTAEDAKNYQGDTKLPVASINAFKGAQGNTQDACFVIASYQEGTVDSAAMLANKTKPSDDTSTDTSTYVPTGTSEETIQTHEGAKTYSLHQYDLKSPTPVQRGNAFGYVQLSKGYVQITSICPTAEDLADTEEALNAISLNL